MDKRVRSPNYPALSLPEAIEKIKVLYSALHTHAAPREVIAKAIGYAGLNGASATAISALNKYGLLDRQGDEHRLSDRARQILAPLSEQEKSEALWQAAFSPPLFAELAEKFPGRINDDLLKNYLSRKGFAPGALAGVVQAYRETSDMVAGMGPGRDSQSQGPVEGPSTLAPLSPAPAPVPNPAIPMELAANERSIGRYDFEGGAFVRIVASSDLDTEEALEMVETLIELKRKELARASKAANRRQQEPISDDEDM